MEIKIKDLPTLLAGMNPEAVIRVNGGYSEYSTSDVEIVESDGIVTIQESTRLRTDRYKVVDIPNDVHEGFDKLVIFNSYLSQLSDLYRLFEKSFSGKIVIDTLFKAGNNLNRFLQATVTDGVLDPKSVEIIYTERKAPIRVFSNSVIRQDPERLESSVLSSVQQKMLLQGISI